MARNITRHGLACDVALKCGISQEQAGSIITELLSSIKSHMMAGHVIELRGFGTFSHQHRKKRPVRNIHTGEAMMLSERIVPVLKFCPSFQRDVTFKEISTEE